jgi:hypothetical protein
MADNTQINTGSGDIIRTIARTTSKTQVIQLDAGGEQGPELLVTSGTPLPVTEQGQLTNLLTQILLEIRALRVQYAIVSGVVVDPETNEAASVPNWN